MEQGPDEVERELLQEMEVFQGVAALLQRMLEQIVEQIRYEVLSREELNTEFKPIPPSGELQSPVSAELKCW